MIANPANPLFRFALALVAANILLVHPDPALADAPAEEIRAVWIEAWKNDLHTPAGIDKVIADAKAANINTLIPQMRRRGDTLHFSDIEPRVSALQPDFDALEYITEKAHAQNPPMEVHAWVVMYPVSRSNNPAHITRKHPEWLTQKSTGELGNHQLDPGHPGVQQHLLDICMELITKYPIDGIHYDYIRYDGNEWGYNPVALERFQRLYGRDDVPEKTDPEWSEFRRNQITQTVRRIYLYAMEARPEVKIAASTITWSPAPENASDFKSTRPYNDILSNWPAWMEEGILDLNVPMNYFRAGADARNENYTRWSNFIKDNRFNRHAAIGPALYLNSIPNSLDQIRETREPTASGPGADGVSLYSYQSTNLEGEHPRDTFFTALANPSEFDSESPVFAKPAAIPEMPWKTKPATGHLKGYVRHAGTDQPIDGAKVHLTGAEERIIQTDATGFYGFVDLPPGTYSVTASWKEFEEDAPARTTSIVKGKVANQDLHFAASR